MRKILLIVLVFIFSLLLYKCAYSEDNILALDESLNKKDETIPDKSVKKGEDNSTTIKTEDEKIAGDDSDKELEKMRSHRKHIENKQKELDLIKLDLEKDSLLLKEKEAQKEIYQIDKILPQGNIGTSMGKGTGQDLKEENIDPSDIKIQLLVIADNLKEGQISFKNTVYDFKEGDITVSKLRVERIDSSGVTFRMPDGAVLKLNFIN